MLRLWKEAIKSQRKLVLVSDRNMANRSADDTSSSDNRSIHSDNVKEVHNVPIHIIVRPFPPELDELKVQSLMDTIKESADTSIVPPIDVLWIKGREGGNYYYSFGGCHRLRGSAELGRRYLPSFDYYDAACDCRVKIYQQGEM